MNGLMFAFGIIFLIMGVAGVLYTPTIVHGFYEYTGLDKISLYQNERVINDIINSYRLAGFVSTIAGIGFIFGSKF